MKFWPKSAALCLLLLSSPAFSQSTGELQTQIDSLGKCLSLKSTGADRLTLAGWIASAMASAPQLKDVAVVSPEKRDELNREVAKIFTRLITVDCTEVAKPLLKAGNTQAFGASFEVLGRLAMQELTGNPEAARAMTEFTKYVNPEDFAAIRK